MTGLRPVWWRWLVTAPEPVRETDRAARASWLLIQLPLTGLILAAHAIARHTGLLTDGSVPGVVMLTLATLVLI